MQYVITDKNEGKMKKILIAVDDTKSTKSIFSKCTRICKCMNPESLILLYVEQYEGRSLITDMLQDKSELATLKEVLEGTEYKEALGKKAEKNFMPMQDGDVVSTYADVGGLIKEFDYKPDTKLADGVNEFVEWYREFYR